MGAFFDPSIETALRSVIFARVGCSSCAAAGLFCFSSNCRIWRSSLRISSACWRVMPCSPDCCAASGRTARTAAYTNNFFMRYLILSQDQHVLAVWNVFPLGEEMKAIALYFFDHVRHVEPDVRDGAPARHRLGPLIVLDNHQFTVRFERFVDPRQHLIGIVEVMVDVERQHHVDAA